MATKIVLTGGPCGGKTTALSKLAERLEGFGYRVLCVPESATMLFKGGMSFADLGSSQVLLLQEVMMRTTIALEDSFDAVSKAYGGKTVILCDRGAIDIKAFCEPFIWNTLLDTVVTHEGKLMDRYDAVIHMVTAAIGAPEFYTLENNSARTETPEQAAVLDKAIQDAWVGHSHMRIVNNETDFDEKVRRVIAHICQIVGIPEPIENERRFLVRFKPDESTPDFHHVTVPIAQDYLVSQDGSESRVRMRTALGHRSYTQTTKIRRAPGSAVEKERRLTPREYVTLMSSRDPGRDTIHKDRQCFVWAGHYIELDTFRDLPIQILEVEVADLDEELELPPFVEVLDEITGVGAYSNYNLAKRLHDQRQTGG